MLNKLTEAIEKALAVEFKPVEDGIKDIDKAADKEVKKEIKESALPYAEGTTPNELDNIWVLRGWLDNMDAEDGEDNIEFTKIGLIEYVNEEYRDYSSGDAVETDTIADEDISDEELMSLINDGGAPLPSEFKVIEIRPYSTGFNEELNEVSDTLVNKVSNRRRINASKANANFNQETGEGFADMVDAKAKLDKNNELVKARAEKNEEYEVIVPSEVAYYLQYGNESELDNETKAEVDKLYGGKDINFKYDELTDEMTPDFGFANNATTIIVNETRAEKNEDAQPEFKPVDDKIDDVELKAEVKKELKEDDEVAQTIKAAIDEYVAAKGDYVEIYADYNDTLSDETIEKIFDDPENGYDIISELYEGNGYFGDDEYDYLIENELDLDEEFIEENRELIEEMVRERIGVGPDYDHFLDTEVRVDIFPNIGNDSGYDAYKFDDNGLAEVGDPFKFFLDKQGVSEEEFIAYYNEQQDYEQGSGKTGYNAETFKGSMVQEIDNFYKEGYCEPVILGQLNLKELVKAGKDYTLEISAGGFAGVVDTANGCGSVIGLEIEKPFTLASQDCRVKYYHGYKYNVDNIYGMASGAWKAEIEVKPTQAQPEQQAEPKQEAVKQVTEEAEDEEPIKVVFRKIDDDVVALFPTNVAYGDGSIESYMHVGQHGPADRNAVEELEPATPEEYADLLAELKSVGYDNLIIEESMNEDKYLSDEDIAAQYNGFKCTYIEVKPSKVNEGWFNFTLELEFPDADHPDFSDYVIENGYYSTQDEVWGFDNWYPEATMEQLKDLVRKEVAKLQPEEEEEDYGKIEGIQRIDDKHMIALHHKTGKYMVHEIDDQAEDLVGNCIASKEFDTSDEALEWYNSKH